MFSFETKIEPKTNQGDSHANSKLGTEAAHALASKPSQTEVAIAGTLAQFDRAFNAPVTKPSDLQQAKSTPAQTSANPGYLVMTPIFDNKQYSEKAKKAADTHTFRYF